MDTLVHGKSFVAKIFLLQKIVFKCSSQFWSTTVHNSCPIKHPFFLCDVVISNLSGVFINPPKEFAVDSDILIRGKWKRCFRKNFYDMGRNLICFFGTLIIRYLYSPFLLVTVIRLASYHIINNLFFQDTEDIHSQPNIDSVSFFINT